MAKQLTNSPTRKVAAGGVAGALTSILVWAANTFWMPIEMPIPAEIAAAITTVISFSVSWFVAPAPSDQIRHQR